MNICKSSGLSARTKSLREKFSSKRSFSELSFAAPSTSTSSLAASESSATRSGSFRSSRSSSRRIKAEQLHQQQQQQRSGSPMSSRAREKEITNEIIKVATGTAGCTSFLPEDAYSSALDINCQLDGEPRFPWQRDVAIQCDLLIPSYHHQSRNTPQILVDSSDSTTTSMIGSKKGFGSKVASFLSHSDHHKSATSVHTTIASSPGTSVHPAAAHLLCTSDSNVMNNLSSSTSVLPSITGPPVKLEPVIKKHSFAGLRFWKSSNILTPEEQMLQQQQQQQQQQNIKQGKSRHKTSYPTPMRSNTPVIHKKSVLQRAVSFDSRGGYSKLISNDSICSIDKAGCHDVHLKSDPHRSSDITNDNISSNVFSGENSGYLLDLDMGPSPDLNEIPMSPSRSELTILPAGSVLVPPATPESGSESPTKLMGWYLCVSTSLFADRK